MEKEQGKANAQRLEEYRLSVIQERWLSTLILNVHLEIQAVLRELLRRALPKPNRLLENNHARLTFAQTLAIGEGLDLIENKVANAIWALNSLRNELAHHLDGAPSLDGLSRFVAAMSQIHALRVSQAETGPAKELRTLQQVRSHFQEADQHEIDHFIFVSLLLLRANLTCLLDRPVIAP